MRDYDAISHAYVTVMGDPNLTRTIIGRQAACEKKVF